MFVGGVLFLNTAYMIPPTPECTLGRFTLAVFAANHFKRDIKDYTVETSLFNFLSILYTPSEK